MTKDFKLDVIVYSDSGAIGFYWPLPLKEKYRPLVAFFIKEQPSDKLLQEFNSKNSCWVIEDKDFIDGIMKIEIEDSFSPNSYIKEIADLYTTIKYNRENSLKDKINFNKIPKIVTSEFLFQLLYSYLGIFTDEHLENENSTAIFDLASEMSYRNYGPGLFVMAACYLKGIGTKKSKNKFIKYLNKSCDKNFEIAIKTKKDIDTYLETF